MASEPFLQWPPSTAAEKGEDEEALKGEKVGKEVLLSEGELIRRNLSRESDIRKRLDKSRRKKEAVRKEAKKSIGFVNAAAGLDGCDDQLLPSSFRALEADLEFHPRSLGTVTLAQTLCLAISSPLWGYLSDRHSRRIILAVGCFSWGVITLILSFASTFWHVVVLRALNGVFLGCIGPVSQSIISDVISSRRRGLGFGMVQLSACFGRILGGLTTSMSMLVFHGIRGWRWAFMAVGCLSMILSFVILVFLHEPPSNRSRRSDDASLLDVEPLADTGGPSPPSYHRVLPNTTEHQSAWEFWKEMCATSLLMPTTLIVMCEGMFGTIPWSALSFMTMFMQYCSLSDVRAAATTALMLLGAMVAGPLGGWVGDKMHSWSPAHGRPIMGQLAVVLRLPLVISTFTLIPKQEDSFWMFLIISFFFGSFSIAGVAVNRPIMADVVRPQHRGTVFALLMMLEGGMAALLGAPLVGVLSEKLFGYESTTHMVGDMPDELRNKNAEALGKALLLMTTIPWVISFIFYSAVHMTYETDALSIKQYIRRRRLEGADDHLFASSGVDTDADGNEDPPRSPTLPTEASTRSSVVEDDGDSSNDNSQHSERNSVRNGEEERNGDDLTEVVDRAYQHADISSWYRGDTQEYEGDGGSG